MASGIVIIVFVASLVGLPFMDSDTDIQQMVEKTASSDDDAERRMLDLIAHEKAEMEIRAGGKIALP